jgi:formamidopyrimidine-DNA glycosylase
MPELPEVEVTRRRLAPHFVGRRIERVQVTKPSYFFLTPPATLAKKLRGRVITGLTRHGKYLMAALDDGAHVLLHLGMTGQLFTQMAKSPRLLTKTARGALSPEAQVPFTPDLHTHMQFHFADGGQSVFFRDTRKFGKVRWLAPGQTEPRLEKLGPDALDVTGEALFSATRGRKIPVKSLLLDQSVLAGAGNIYADEALFAAAVRPTRPARQTTRKQCEAIVAELHRVLLRSIETGGSSISDYVNPDGSDGGYQDERTVYARTGEPCLRCGKKILRRVIAQRSTHYCSGCQK